MKRIGLVAIAALTGVFLIGATAFAGCCGGFNPYAAGWGPRPGASPGYGPGSCCSYGANTASGPARGGLSGLSRASRSHPDDGAADGARPRSARARGRQAGERDPDPDGHRDPLRTSLFHAAQHDRRAHPLRAVWTPGGEIERRHAMNYSRPIVCFFVPWLLFFLGCHGAPRQDSRKGPAREEPSSPPAATTSPSSPSPSCSPRTSLRSSGAGPWSARWSSSF